MKRKLLGLFSILVLVVIAFGGTFTGRPTAIDGQVLAMFRGSCIFIIDQAMAAKTGTVILEGNGFYVFGSAVDGGFGYVVVDALGKLAKSPSAVIPNSGNLVTLGDWLNIEENLVEHGWQKIAPAGVSAEALRVIRLLKGTFGYKIMSLFRVSAAETSLIVIPVVGGADGFFNSFVSQYQVR